MAEDGTGDEPGTEWLTIAAAARRLRVTPRAIRGRIARNSIEWKVAGNHGRLVRVTATDVARDEPGTDPGDEIEDLRAELTAALIAQAQAEAHVEAKDILIGELRKMLEETRKPWWRRLIG